MLTQVEQYQLMDCRMLHGNTKILRKPLTVNVTCLCRHFVRERFHVFFWGKNRVTEPAAVCDERKTSLGIIES